MTSDPATARGGPQAIPRPAGWLAGGPAPWGHLAERGCTLDDVVVAVAGREPVGSRGGRPTGAEQAAGVLVALYDDGGPHLVLTRRSPRLNSHTHEVSFPGGRRDPDDADLWATALREAHEETGLDPSIPRFVGRLDPIVTVGSASLIHPFVAVLPDRPDLTANPEEVEAIRLVGFDELLSDEVWREERWPRSGDPWVITFFELVGDTVWGATAAMLRQLLALSLGVDDGMIVHGGTGR